jgi:hypothetical protein
MDILIKKSEAVITSWGHKNESVDSLAPYLGAKVSFAEGFTFLDLMRWIEKDAEFFAKVFSVPLGGFSLEPFLKEAFASPTEELDEKDPDNSIHHLFLGWSVNNERDYDGEKSFTLSVELHGQGKIVSKFGEDKGEVIDQAYGLSFSPLNNLGVYELKIDNHIEILPVNWEKYAAKHRERPKCILDSNLDMTLFDALYGVFFEISFMGEPSDRAVKSAQLDQTVTAVDLGEVEMIPWETVKEEMMEKHPGIRDIMDRDDKDDFDECGLNCPHGSNSNDGD